MNTKYEDQTQPSFSHRLMDPIVQSKRYNSMRNLSNVFRKKRFTHSKAVLLLWNLIMNQKSSMSLKVPRIGNNFRMKLFIYLMKRV